MILYASWVYQRCAVFELLLWQGGDFLSIDLVGGKVIVQFYLGGESTARSETSNTYNDNKWTKITLTRIKLEGQNTSEHLCRHNIDHTR